MKEILAWGVAYGLIALGCAVLGLAIADGFDRTFSPPPAEILVHAAAPSNAAPLKLPLTMVCTPPSSRPHRKEIV